MGFLTELFLSLAPFFLFIGVWIIVFFRGSKVNKGLMSKIEEDIHAALKPHATDVKRVKIRPDEYEYRCKPKNKNISILTIHLKLVSRSFIVQWLINLFYKERDRLFLGLKFSNSQGDDDPVYRFDIVPYRKKSYISQRFDLFVAMDDIPTTDKSVDRKFMVKSESVAYVEHFTENKEFISYISKMEDKIEHLTIHKSKEETDPHLSVTFEFFGARDDYNIQQMMQFFFLTATLHLNNHATVKKKVIKGTKGKSMTKKRGSARTGAGRKKRPKKKRKN